MAKKPSSATPPKKRASQQVGRTNGRSQPSKTPLLDIMAGVGETTLPKLPTAIERRDACMRWGEHCSRTFAGLVGPEIRLPGESRAAFTRRRQRRSRTSGKDAFNEGIEYLTSMQVVRKFKRIASLLQYLRTSSDSKADLHRAEADVAKIGAGIDEQLHAILKKHIDAAMAKTTKGGPGRRATWQGLDQFWLDEREDGTRGSEIISKYCVANGALVGRNRKNGIKGPTVRQAIDAAKHLKRKQHDSRNRKNRVGQ